MNDPLTPPRKPAGPTAGPTQGPSSDSAAGAADLPGRPAAFRAGLLGFLVGAVCLVLLARHLHYFVDDAFITFRYSRNWAEWGLPVFNSFELKEGVERAEGYSNLLWMGLLSLLHRFGADLETITPPLQMLVGVLTVGLVARAGVRQLRLGALGAFMAPVLLATAAPFAAWATGGMETGLFTLLLAGFFLSALRPSGDSRGLQLGLLGGLVALVRVEGIAWVLGTLGAVLVAECLAGRGLTRVLAEKRRLVLGVAIAIALLGVQLSYRKVVYGDWVSNTVTAKTGGTGSDFYGRGLRQVASWGLVTLTPIFALLALPPALMHPSKSTRCAALAAFLTALGFVFYNVVTGGDWMPYFRFLAPVAPMLALLIAAGLDRIPKAAAIAAGAVVLAVQPLTLFEQHVAPLSVREALRFRSFKGGYRSELERINTARVNAEYFGQLGAALAIGTEPGDVLAFGAIGSPGWYAPGLDFLDRNGLVTPIVAQREVALGEGTAGHEKRVPHAFFLDQGEPQPKWLFAKLLDALIDGPTSPFYAEALRQIRQDGVVGRKPERELFQRTTLHLVPIREGTAAGKT
ncbi:MAG: arabinofuranosyltransferase, partial [Planctomycetota bacterium]